MGKSCLKSKATLFFHLYMRRNTSSSLRFPLVVYVYVHSRRGSLTLLVLLASKAKKSVYSRNTLSNLRIFIGHVRLCTLPQKLLVLLVLLASKAKN